MQNCIQNDGIFRNLSVQDSPIREYQYVSFLTAIQFLTINTQPRAISSVKAIESGRTKPHDGQW